MPDPGATGKMLSDDPRFRDPHQARAWLEAQRWPHGPICPHCGNADQSKIRALHGKAHRPGLYQCYECQLQFTVTVGTPMHRSRVPLHKWVLAMHLMSIPQERVSLRRLQQILGVAYDTAWRLSDRIRTAGGRSKKRDG